MFMGWFLLGAPPEQISDVILKRRHATYGKLVYHVNLRCKNAQYFRESPRRRPKHERFLQAASHQLTVAIGQAPGRQKKAGVGGAGEPPEPAAPAEKSHR